MPEIEFYNALKNVLSNTSAIYKELGNTGLALDRSYKNSSASQRVSFHVKGPNKLTGSSTEANRMRNLSKLRHPDPKTVAQWKVTHPTLQVAGSWKKMDVPKDKSLPSRGGFVSFVWKGDFSASTRYT